MLLVNGFVHCKNQLVCLKNTALGWVSQGKMQYLALPHDVLVSQHTPLVLYLCSHMLQWTLCDQWINFVCMCMCVCMILLLFCDMVVGQYATRRPGQVHQETTPANTKDEIRL